MSEWFTLECHASKLLFQRLIWNPRVGWAKWLEDISWLVGNGGQKSEAWKQRANKNFINWFHLEAGVHRGDLVTQIQALLRKFSEVYIATDNHSPSVCTALAIPAPLKAETTIYYVWVCEEVGTYRLICFTYSDNRKEYLKSRLFQKSSHNYVLNRPIIWIWKIYIILGDYSYLRLEK